MRSLKVGIREIFTVKECVYAIAEKSGYVGDLQIKCPC